MTNNLFVKKDAGFFFSLEFLNFPFCKNCFASLEISDFFVVFLLPYPLCERKGKSLIFLISGLNSISEDLRKAVVVNVFF